MALYKIDSEKLMAGEYWSNVYHTDAPDLATALTIAQDVVDAEREVHNSLITFTKIRVSEEGTLFFQTQPVNQPGLIANPTDWLPLFNTVRVDGAVLGRRPVRKYLRVAIGEGNQSNGILSSAYLALIATQYAGAIDVLNLTNPEGLAISAWTVFPAIQMRQLRRGSRRRTTAIL